MYASRPRAPKDYLERAPKARSRARTKKSSKQRDANRLSNISRTDRVSNDDALAADERIPNAAIIVRIASSDDNKIVELSGVVESPMIETSFAFAHRQPKPSDDGAGPQFSRIRHGLVKNSTDGVDGLRRSSTGSQTRRSINRKSLREIPADDIRRSGVGMKKCRW